MKLQGVRDGIIGIGVKCEKASKYKKNRKGRPRLGREDRYEGKRSDEDGKGTQGGTSSQHRHRLTKEKKRILDPQIKIPLIVGPYNPFVPNVDEMIKKGGGWYVLREQMSGFLLRNGDALSSDTGGIDSVQTLLSSFRYGC